jgi:hypothetical protein
LMLILPLDLYTLWMQVMLPMFRRYVLLPSSQLKWIGWRSVHRRKVGVWYTEQ